MLSSFCNLPMKTSEEVALRPLVESREHIYNPIFMVENCGLDRVVFFPNIIEGVFLLKLSLCPCSLVAFKTYGWFVLLILFFIEST